MLRNTINGIIRPHVPTLDEIQRRRAELLSLLQPSQPQSPEPPFLNPAPPAEARLTPAPGPSVTPKLGEAALHGLAGLAVRTIAPHTEAHPAAILLQLLAVFGNLAGRGPRKMQRHSRCASQAPYS